MEGIHLLFIDLPASSGISVLNWESFQYGLDIVGSSGYNLIYELAPDNTQEATRLIVLTYLEGLDPSIILSQRVAILVLSSNQLFGTRQAIIEYGGDDLLNQILIISSSGLGVLPTGANVSLNYSGQQEVESVVLHQKIHEISYVICVYEQNNQYCEDYVHIYRDLNLVKKVIYLPLQIGQVDTIAKRINLILKRSQRKNPCLMYHLELLLVLFTPETDLLLSQIKYRNGIRALAGIASDGLDPKTTKKFPIMLSKLAPLDITRSLKDYYLHMLMYPEPPSSFAPAYYDAGVQLGQMIRLGQTMTVSNFSNRLTQFYSEPTAQYGGAWINPDLRRVEFSSYYYMWTYDPVIGPNKLDEYRKRSPWMPVIPNSASLPYKINNAFWVQPKRWIVYYSPWRNMLNVANQPLKYYLGIDSSDQTVDYGRNPFTVTGYASSILNIYFSVQRKHEIPLLTIPEQDQPIFEYPFNVIRDIVFPLKRKDNIPS